MGLPNICVTVTPIIGTDVVGFETDFMGTVTRQVACLQDKAVHDRLVALGWAPPASAAPKDHQIAALVNKVRDIARMFHDHQSLRERIAIELVPAIKASQEVKSNAERCRFILAAADDMTTSRYKSLCELLGVAITEDFDLGAAIDAAMLAAKDTK